MSTTMQPKLKKARIVKESADGTAATSISAVAAAAPAKPSSVFAPFRALGTVANDVPFSLQALGADNFLTTCVGNAFHVYNVDRFRLMAASSPTPEPITSLAAHKDTTYAACRNIVYIFHRGKRTGELVNPDVDGSIFQLLLLGDYLLGLSDDNQLTVWDLSTPKADDDDEDMDKPSEPVANDNKVYSTVQFGSNFSTSCFMHPHTYLNKVLVGSSEGTMQIWNVKTNKLIYEFESIGSAVTTVVQSPVIDVVAVGTLDGHIHLHNLKSDERIGSYHQETRVTAIAFRTDNDMPLMASANQSGDIAIWDLEKRRLIHNVKGAHEGTIPSIQFLLGQPVLVTSGADNAIKQFIFDSPDGVPRLLKFRAGHAAPPTSVKFYDDDGKYLVTAAKDRAMRIFSVVKDAHSFEFSQGKGTGTAANTGTHATKGAKRLGISLDTLRLPPVTSVAMCETTQRDWDNVVTAHEGESEARLWSFQRKALGKHTLAARDGSTVKAVAMTACGNFAVLGTEAGNLDVYNVQSGKFRRSFTGGHSKAITGIVVDRINKCLVSSSLDKSVRVWDFATGKSVYSIPMHAPITQLVAHMDNELVAVVSDDLSIRVLDLETRRIVREFWGHRNRITDVAFSPDGRWLVSASLDATVKTWDLPTGFLVDQFRVDHVVTSLTFSPMSDFLATTHVDSLAVFLWSNRTQYTNISLRPLTDDDEVVEQALPTSADVDSDREDEGTEKQKASAGTAEVVVAAEVAYSDYVTPEQITEHLITLSKHPKSRWQTLLNIEAVKARNKPIEPPKEPEKAPFFLPTVAGVVPTFAPDANKSVDDDGTVRAFGQLSLDSEFLQVLKQCDEQGNYDVLHAMLVDMSPSAIDLEIRMLSELHLRAFIQALIAHLNKHQAFELGQAWMNVFLKCHGEALTRSDEFRDDLHALLEAHEAEWNRVQANLRYCNCLLDFVRF
ncbi:Utp21 specific WD40 associated putative domain-domain-containing protein [Catenaria anguillulae PL171]|uniref:Utp21 specific WD40 associated putative domain-domain-containing protein n=1 Tax=Catenaria anguillulae PL171 TaxID=765915 RepID=A0A1Y2HY57_9FUNG|nr:Utp21 specific WD40 associated putative domain-domain-containing protein [Catenaria anguillulae PL171]